MVSPRFAADSRSWPDATGVGWVYLYALVDRTGQNDISQLRSLQDWFLKYELQTVPGVSEVSALGGMVKQYQVKIDPEKLRAYGIPLSHIQMAIKRGNQEVGASVIEMAEAEYMVRASGYISSIDDLKNIPLKNCQSLLFSSPVDGAYALPGAHMRSPGSHMRSPKSLKLKNILFPKKLEL